PPSAQRDRGADAQDRAHDGGGGVALPARASSSPSFSSSSSSSSQSSSSSSKSSSSSSSRSSSSRSSTSLSLSFSGSSSRAWMSRASRFCMPHPLLRMLLGNLGDCLTSHLPSSVHGAAPLAFHLEAERADHGARVRVALAGCGEVALHDDG